MSARTDAALLQQTVTTACGMGLSTFLWMFLIGVLCSPFCFAGTAKRHAPRAKDQPVWQLDLKPFGFVRPKSDWETTNSRIVFISGETVVPTWLSRQDLTSAVPAGETPTQIPQRLQALFVDAATGKVRTTKEWPTASEVGRIIPAVNGKFIVLTVDKSTLYSPSFHPVLELGSGHKLEVSPDGRTILIKDEMGSSQCKFRWIDLDSLEVFRSWTENEQENMWRGPEDIVARGGNMGPICDDQMVRSLSSIGFLIRSLDGPWRLVRIQR